MSKSCAALVMVAVCGIAVAWDAVSACDTVITFLANGFMHHTASSATMTATGTEQNRVKVRTSWKHNGAEFAFDDRTVTSDAWSHTVTVPLGNLYISAVSIQSNGTLDSCYVYKGGSVD